MSKFITNSSNFSESHFLKSKLLKPILDSYNKLLLEDQTKFVDKMEVNRFIPNNGNKYYLFVTDKSNIPNMKSNYKILYFFPENESPESSDFFIETEYTNFHSLASTNVLLEGYIYNKNDKPHYLVTDILYKGTHQTNKSLNCDYTLRLKLISDIIGNGIRDINCFIDINVHPTFKCIENEDDAYDSSLLSIFRSNFIYAKEITNIEFVKERCIGYKTNKTSKITIKTSECKKRIEKTKYSDTYKVFDIETGNQEGILYVKTIAISKRLRELTKQSETITLDCEYNTSFCKWSPKLN
jgi:hypothetical protein